MKRLIWPLLLLFIPVPASAAVKAVATPAINLVVAASVGSTFSVASGCGTVGSVSGSATTGTFTAGQAACVPVITLPQAAHGWYCSAHDITHTADLFVQTASGTTSCTLSSTVTSADVIIFHAEDY